MKTKLRFFLYRITLIEFEHFFAGPEVLYIPVYWTIEHGG